MGMDTKYMFLIMHHNLTLQKSEFPDASQGPTLPAGVSKEWPQACWVNSSLHSS